mmetsp:Transcript_1893/g.4426  ORF Transcript_1893/g.4426 Transcript_1893/m.4426 type:complete len:383 (-) Transcript_1893:7-1155(-)
MNMSQAVAAPSLRRTKVDLSSCPCSTSGDRPSKAMRSSGCASTTSKHSDASSPLSRSARCALVRCSSGPLFCSDCRTLNCSERFQRAASMRKRPRLFGRVLSTTSHSMSWGSVNSLSCVSNCPAGSTTTCTRVRCRSRGSLLHICTRRLTASPKGTRTASISTLRLPLPRSISASNSAQQSVSFSTPVPSTQRLSSSRYRCMSSASTSSALVSSQDSASASTPHRELSNTAAPTLSSGNSRSFTSTWEAAEPPGSSEGSRSVTGRGSRSIWRVERSRHWPLTRMKPQPPSPVTSGNTCTASLWLSGVCMKAESIFSINSKLRWAPLQPRAFMSTARERDSFALRSPHCPSSTTTIAAAKHTAAWRAVEVMPHLKSLLPATTE